MDDLFATLSGGEKFSKLDLAFAYQQLELDESSKELLTVNTHRGLFQPTRPQSGVHSASSIFQRDMERLLWKVTFTKVRVDDILVSGRNDEEHRQSLNIVLMILSDNGLRSKLKKCVFMSPETEYLGFTISKNGVSPKKDKVEAIQNAPIPTNTTQIKSFLGMINYYHKHLPNLATILEPLHRLLHKGVPWIWGKLEEVAFERAKEMLCSPKLLVHYDPEKPLVLTCDASLYRNGGVLAHVMPDRSERPILYASRV